MLRLAGSTAWSRTAPDCKSVYPSTSVPVLPSTRTSLTILATGDTDGRALGLEDVGFVVGVLVGALDGMEEGDAVTGEALVVVELTVGPTEGPDSGLPEG